MKEMKEMKEMKATNIQWDIDIDEALDRLDAMEVDDAAEELGIPAERYASMSTEERHDIACDKWHHAPGSLDDFMGLPDEVEVPMDLLCSEDPDEYIANWLSDEYGFCHNGFELER